MEARLGDTPRRKRLRYPGYDYAQPGATLVTICTHDRQPLFGRVEDGLMRLNPAVRMVADTWLGLEGRFPGVIPHAFVVMPDHVHGIVLTGTDPAQEEAHATVGLVVRSFKASVIRAWRESVERHGWPRYQGHLWQQDFHDRIIRRDEPLDHVRAYIEGNPGRWTERHDRGQDP
jgi:putative transposase